MTAPSAWTGTPPPASSSVWRGVPGSRRRSHRTRCATGSSPPPRCRRRPARRSRSRLTRRPENDDALRQSETISRSARYLHSRHLRRRRQPPRNSAWRHQPNKWRLPPHLLVVGTIRISTSECTYCRPVSLVCPRRVPRHLRPVSTLRGTPSAPQIWARDGHASSAHRKRYPRILGSPCAVQLMNGLDHQTAARLDAIATTARGRASPRGVWFWWLSSRCDPIL